MKHGMKPGWIGYTVACYVTILYKYPLLRCHSALLVENGIRYNTGPIFHHLSFQYKNSRTVSIARYIPLPSRTDSVRENPCCCSCSMLSLSPRCCRPNLSTVLIVVVVGGCWEKLRQTATVSILHAVRCLYTFSSIPACYSHCRISHSKNAAVSTKTWRVDFCERFYKVPAFSCLESDVV